MARSPYVEQKVREALMEDLGFTDLTSEILVPEGAWAEAEIVAKEEGILAGVEEAKTAFELLGAEVVEALRDGSKVRPGDVVIRVRGPARALLAAERTALNFLMRMSGITTATANMVERARSVNPKIRIAATRKTVPGLRFFDKKAVEVGGGDTHRLRLEDCVLIKDNHIAIVGSVSEAVKKAREKVSFTKKIEVEVSSPEEAVEAARAGADIVMLDNFTVEEVSRTLRRLEEEGLRSSVLVEASGRIGLDNVADYAKTGVDVISSGYLTHSAKALDFSMKIIKAEVR
ncbi:nicotinate-nucleotide diphosphorylase (carboxylating) [Candidatus Bathyarchaeota archaeon ex4484_135]|nr:MAG: nicotinate-nucleotide diphosphorylase (carboxylating) [Candidatus Bathyarchaeota archaeon ex4484_135]